ncbi:MAG: hypothetical protein Q8P90_02005 [bacterium]|nr:hypothetical protein [bacterium]
MATIPTKESLQCPYCHEATSIKAMIKFMLPEREVFNNRFAVLNRCAKCTQVYMSVREQSFKKQQDEIWNLYHYYLPLEMQQNFLIKATLCFNPNRQHCRCPAHSMINEIDFSRLERLGD